MVLSRVEIDVMMISISAPDKHGFCSIGPGVDHIPTMKNHAKLIIAQMNKNLPRVMGNSFVHLRDVDIIVEED
jgi:acyl-CoA hydrolase